MKITALMSLAATVALAADFPKAAPEDGTRAERFANPPMSARILPLRHNWSNDRKRADANFAGLLRDGFGGMGYNVNFGTNYLRSATAWDTFRYVTKKARASGMALWLYDEDGYPSGTARDLVLKDHPEWEARGLLVAVTNVAAGGKVSLALPPGTFKRAVACPVVDDFPDTAAGMDIRSSVKDGTVAWEVPAGKTDKWCVIGITEDFLYEGTHAERCLSPRHYINLLMREPTAYFIKITHDRYEKELGEDLKAFTSTFTDEPSLMSSWLVQMPYYVLPTCPDLPADYKARTGRELLDDVPAIVFGDAAEERSARRRYDFWNMVGDRVSRNYMGQLTEWATKRGLLSGGHLLAEEGLPAHVAYYGDFFRCLRALSSPGIDCLTSVPDRVPWITAQFGGSAGALNGSRRVMCEASDHSQRYRKKGDTRPTYQVSEDEIMGSLNRLVWGGVNTFTSYYRWRPFSTEQINRINTTIGREITLMSEGYNSAEVALLYPADTMMSTYRPGVRGGTSRYGSFRSCGQTLFMSGRPYMFVDSRALAEAKVEGDNLVHGKLRWRVVILPDVTTLTSAAMRNLHAFWKAGGAVVAVGACPESSERAFPDDEIRRISAEMFLAGRNGRQANVVHSAAGGTGVLLSNGRSLMLAEVMDRLLEPVLSVAAGADRANLRVASRRTEEGDVLFVLNDDPNAWQGRVKTCGNLPAELWDPRTGAHGPASVEDGCIALDIPGFGAVLLTTPVPAVPARRKLEGGAFDPVTIPFDVAPAVGKLSHARDVSASCSRLADGFVHAEATILKSNVDTFMFVPFEFSKSPCTKDCEGVFAKLRVTADQKRAPNMIVFANMTDGSMYLSHPDVPLSEKGVFEVLVPFESFFSYGKAKTEEKSFDPTKVKSFRFGFGGYFGKVGQKISLDISVTSGYRH